MTFDGKTFVDAIDAKRLMRQFDRVRNVLADGDWLTLGEIRERCRAICRALGIEANDSEAAISARLRDLRKDKFGGTQDSVESRRRGDAKRGLWEYRWNGVK